MLVKWGGGITDGRGSIGGTTFSRNRYGGYARARTKPVNPNSTRQAAIRSIISSVSQNWSSLLTEAQRLAWGVFAANVPAKNKLGEVINLSGFNQYVKSNTTAINAGLDAIADGPTDYTLPGQDPTFAAVISEAAQTVACTFDDGADWCAEDGAGLIVQMGIPQGESIKFFGGPFRHAGVIEGSSTTAPTTGDTVTCPFAVTAGQEIFVRAKIIRADGRLSDWFQISESAGA